MRSTKFNKEASLAAAVLLLVMFCGVNSAAAGNTGGTTDKWQYEFTLYGWVPSIDGTMKFEVPPGSGEDTSVDISEFLDALNFVFMGNFEALHNKLSFGADLLYLNVSNSSSADISVGPEPGVPVSVFGNFGLKAWLATGHVGYDVVQGDKGRLAVLGGLRHLDLSGDLDITIEDPPPPNPPPDYVSGSDNLWDAIVGIKGGIMLSNKWYIPYYADIGAGDSELTMQLYSGIGYMFSWGDIKLAYRYLEYKQEDDRFVRDLKLYGPQVGIGFRF